MPGSVPNRFFSDSVATAQWCVFSFGSEITTSAVAIVCDRNRCSSPVSRPRLTRLDRLVVVEVDERHLVMPQHVAQAAGGHEVFDVAPVARPLGDDDLGRPLAAAQLDDGGDDVRVRC